MKKLVTFMVLAFSVLYSKGQDMPEIVPPSPEASALAKFTEVPVSHYTGMPNISVPFYTIKQKGIEVPISLSYHARGVMVSETASRTGTGWSLQYGGSISRQVRGKGDELLNHGYLVNKPHFMTYSTSVDTRNAVDGNEIMANNSYGGYDFYPDQFNFNAAGTSGKFILNYVDGQPVIQSFGDVKISYTIGSSGNGFNSIDSFKVIDTRGNTYYFGISKDGLRKAQDYQNSVGMSVDYNGNVVSNSPSSVDNRVFSAWKLMDIENAYGELISYYYESDGGSTYARKSNDMTPSNSDSPSSLGDINNISLIKSQISRVTNYEKQLSKITFNNGRDKIVFDKSQTERLDFDGKSLEKISIYNGDKLIKSYQLNYSFTTSTDTSNMLVHLVNDPWFTKSFSRMFLSSVEEEASNGEKLPSYEFTYDAQVLPSPLSSRQDYWGYYNGAENNGPFTRMFEYGNYVPNRRVNIEKSEAGILKQIKYPTGGVAKFTYEHNIGTAPDYFDTIVVPSINPSSENEIAIVLTKEDFTYINGSYQPVSIDVPAATRISYTFQCHTPLSNINNPAPTDCIFDFTLNNYAVNTIDETFFRYTPNTNNHSGSISFGLYPSDPYTNGNLHLDDAYNFQITIKYHTPDYSSNLYGAGKRIKKIEHFNESGLVSTKEYEYVFPSEAGFGSLGGTPSGGIIGFPAFVNTTTQDNDFDFSNMTKYFDATSAFSSFQANTIGYGGVIEYNGTKENNIGKIEYTFTNIADSGGDYWEFPWHPPTDNEWLRGKPVRTRVFKKQENGSYSLLKEAHNKYSYADTEYEPDYELPGFRDLNFELTPLGTDHNWFSNTPFNYVKNRTFFRLPLFMKKRVSGTSPSVENWGYRIYDLTGGTLNLKRSTTKEYFADGNVSETITENFFDYNKHYQQKSTKVTDSKGDVVETKNYYPTDATQIHPNYASSAFLADQVSRIGDLLNDNRFEVVQTESYRNSVLQSKLQNKYLKQDGIIMPKSVMTAKGVSDLEERINYHSYDTDSNVREVSKKDGTSIVYVWGYNRTLPIAKIEGATFSEVQSYISAIETASNADNDRSVDTISGTSRVYVGKEGTLRNALQTLRNGLPNAQVTTFTYDPLIGATSITDARGRTLYYHYDAFNRLEAIKDHDGNTVSKTTYNYKN